MNFRMTTINHLLVHNNDSEKKVVHSAETTVDTHECIMNQFVNVGCYMNFFSLGTILMWFVMHTDVDMLY